MDSSVFHYETLQKGLNSIDSSYLNVLFLQLVYINCRNHENETKITDQYYPVFNCECCFCAGLYK